MGRRINGPVQLGDDLADSLGSAGGGGDDVLAGAAAVSPQLARGAVHGLLSGGDGVNCALGGRGQRISVCSRRRRHPAWLRGRLRPHHQALNDSEVVVDDLGQGSQAVCRAGSVAMEPKMQLKSTRMVALLFFWFFF